MANNSRQFNTGNSSAFTDEEIRRFLLGELRTTELSRFEEQLFNDDSLETRVRLAEYELTDDYAFDRLHLSDRELFEQKFLLSTDRKQKLRVSNALRNCFVSVSSAVPFGEKIAVRDKLRVFLRFPQPPLRYAWAVVILLFLIGALWLAVKAPRIREKLLVRRSPVERPAPLTFPRETHHASPTLNHHETSSPAPPNEQPDSPATAEPAVSVVLSSASSFEKRQSPLVNLSNSEQAIVRLMLPVEPNQPGTLSADLLTIDGQFVFSALLLKTDDRDGTKAYLDVSAGLIKTGEYQIKLSREGSSEQVGTFYFRVQ